MHINAYQHEGGDWRAQAHVTVEDTIATTAEMRGYECARDAVDAAKAAAAKLHAELTAPKIVEVPAPVAEVTTEVVEPEPEAAAAPAPESVTVAEPTGAPVEVAAAEAAPTGDAAAPEAAAPTGTPDAAAQSEASGDAASEQTAWPPAGQ